MNSATEIRLIIFFAIVLTIAVLEFILPRRNQISRKRWLANIPIVIIDTVLVRLLFPLGAVGVALWASQQPFGVLNLVSLPGVLAAILAFLILDLAIYFQHRVFHALPGLWRLHRLHHSDVEFDFTTALRFHPVEILLSMLIKIAVIVLIGAPVLAVMAFEIVLNGAAMFNHANIRLPQALDRVIRWVIVTPDMHRVHHSAHRDETNSNFGFNIPWWDRLFGTYCAQPRDGHETMRIGLDYFRSPREQRLDQLLLQPLQSQPNSR